MIKALKMIVVAGCLAVAPMQASAADYEVANVMDDALYGGGVGAIVGLGMMLISDTPTSNWNYVTQGLGVGIIAGAAYGVLRSSRAFAEVEDGQINFRMPTPQLAFQQTPSGLDMRVKTDLVSGTF